MEVAIAIGIGLNDFWAMTPHELTLYVKAHVKRKEDDWDEKVSIAWLGAYFQRANKMPKMKEYLTASLKKKAKKQTAEDMLRQIKALNAALGGTTE
jgi:DNA-binding SARP family transcriptional activator